MVTDEIKKTKQLVSENQLFTQGVSLAEKGDWNQALEFLKKLPISSRYYPKVIQNKPISYRKPTGDYVKLVNYVYARDPTWAELVSFLNQDKTDKLIYDLSTFVCTGFAETLHNQAEKAGIRSAFVGIDFQTGPGHAINAFETTDRGLVFVDDTGPGFTLSRDSALEEGNQNCIRDKVAYLAENKEYGTISINYQNVNPTDYTSYTSYRLLWEKLQERAIRLQTNSKLLKQKISAYQESLKSYEKAVNDYNEQVQTQLDQTKQLNQAFEIEIQNDKNTVQKNYDDWLKKKSGYEAKVAEFNPQVTEYNTTGKGDLDQLKARQQELEEESIALNQELDGIKKAEEQINQKISKQNDYIASLSSSNENQKQSLEQQYKELNKQQDEINSLSGKIKAESQAINQREKSLGTCYWKQLGVVTKYEVIW